MSKYSVHIYDKYEFNEATDTDTTTKVLEEVEADSVAIKDGALLFFTDKKLVRAFSKGNWRELNKIF